LADLQIEKNSAIKRQKLKPCSQGSQDSSLICTAVFYNYIIAIMDIEA
jgi:hypothetical protein